MKFLIVALAMLVSTSVFAKAKDCSDLSQYKDVTLPEMQKMAKDPKVAIIDVNSKSSFDKKHIGGDKTIHYGTKAATLAKALPQDKSLTVVAYCGGKQCNAWEDAAIAACKAGFSKVRHFSEGIRGWKEPKNG